MTSGAQVAAAENRNRALGGPGVAAEDAAHVPAGRAPDAEAPRLQHTRRGHQRNLGRLPLALADVHFYCKNESSLRCLEVCLIAFAPKGPNRSLKVACVRGLLR